MTPEEILARARELAAEGYDEIPIHVLLGARWLTDPAAMEPLRSLLRDYLVRWTNRPGFLEIVGEATAERRSIPRNG
jgi:hypothetical protein